MKVTRAAALAAIASFGMGTCHAASLTLASYGSTASAPAGVNNTATLYTAGTSYNVPPSAFWAAPVGVSSWVSDNPNDFPLGGAYPGNGIYTFTSTFFDATPGTSTGTLTVLADDTTAVFLNGTLIVSEAPPTQLGIQCTQATPNCSTAATYNLTGFVAGTNLLTFQVHQDFGAAMGLDYQGSVNTASVVTPEPGSFILLATGLLGMTGKLYRRRAL